MATPTAGPQAARRALAVSLAVLAAAVTIASPSARAADFSLCGDLLQVPARPVMESPSQDPEAVDVAADDAELVEGGVSVLTGNVHVRRGASQLTADVVTYDQPSEIVTAEGTVRLWDEGLYASGDFARVDLGADEALLEDAGYIVPDGHARGSAGRIVVIRREDVVHIEDGTYTTCNPGDEAWRLEASRVELDKVTERGWARNVWVKFQGVPIFYSPVLTFPLTDKRKTGLLTPSFGISEETGAELTVPWYWNIAPNRDATFAVRGMTRRGALLAGEYRYLQDGGRGQIGAEFLPHDREFDDERWAFDYDHDGEYLSRRLRTEVDVSVVSDDDYLEDLGTDLHIASTRHLTQRADVRWVGRGWQLLGRVQGFQTVDDTIRSSRKPYERLPQIELRTTGAERNRRVNLDGYAEFVYFDRSVGVTGSRLDVEPRVSFPVRSVSSFVVPTLKLRNTAYFLEDQAAGATSTPFRTVPTFTLDSGLFFERDWDLGGRTWIQTLEPRLYYLYVPFEEQDDQPVFDTGEFDFNFAQLFRDNRFSGTDRVGDANQVTVALTSRLLDRSSGDELFRASVGQIRFLRDREVTLPGRPDRDRDASDIVAEVSATMVPGWSLRGGVQWDPDQARTDKSTVALRYSPDPGRVLNLSYRFVRDEVEQTDVSLRWPWSNRWATVGRWNWSIEGSRTLEALGGVEYESCCWAMRAVVRHYVNDVDADATTGFFLQLELKGLAGIGRSTGTFLERSIPGYKNQF